MCEGGSSAKLRQMYAYTHAGEEENNAAKLESLAATWSGIKKKRGKDSSPARRGQSPFFSKYHAAGFGGEDIKLTALGSRN